MAEKRFMRVKDKRTRHVYDVDQQAFDPDIHEELKRFLRSSVARPAKPYTKASTRKVVEGVSPAGVKLATPKK